MESKGQVTQHFATLRSPVPQADIAGYVMVVLTKDRTVEVVGPEDWQLGLEVLRMGIERIKQARLGPNLIVPVGGH